MKVWTKFYQQGRDTLLAACDEDCLGKREKFGEIDFEVSEAFYKGDLVELYNFKELLAQATIANLVGEESVNCAIKLGLVNRECILTIKGIPHAQMVKIF